MTVIEKTKKSEETILKIEHLVKRFGDLEEKWWLSSALQAVGKVRCFAA